MLWCIDPVQRSIERTRSVLLGTLVGVCKVPLPFTGIVIFILKFEAQQPKPEDFNRHVRALGPKSVVINLIGLFGILVGCSSRSDQRLARSTLSAGWIPLKCCRSKGTRSQSPGRCHG